MATGQAGLQTSGCVRHQAMPHLLALASMSPTTTNASIQSDVPVCEVKGLLDQHGCARSGLHQECLRNRLQTKIMPFTVCRVHSGPRHSDSMPQ